MRVEAFLQATGCLFLCSATLLIFPLSGRSQDSSPVRASDQGLAKGPPNTEMRRKRPFVIPPNRLHARIVVQRWLAAGGYCPKGQWSLRAKGKGKAFQELREQLRGIKGNDILVSAPRDDAPDGFIRRVWHTKNVQGHRIYCTVQASLADANPERPIVRTLDFRYDDIASVTALRPNVTVSPPVPAPKSVKPQPATANDPPASAKVCLNAGEGFETSFQRTPVKADVEADGSFRLCPKLSLRISYGFFRLRSARLRFTLGEVAAIHLTGQAVGQVERRQDLAKIRFRTFVVDVGIPVVLRPVVTIYLAEEGSFQSKVTAGISQSAKATRKMDYQNGKWTSTPLHLSLNPLTFEGPTIQANSAVKASLGADIEVEVYGLIGPSLEPSVFVEAARSAAGKCTRTTGLEGSAGVNLLVLGHVVRRENFPSFFTYPVSNEDCR